MTDWYSAHNDYRDSNGNRIGARRQVSTDDPAAIKAALDAKPAPSAPKQSKPAPPTGATNFARGLSELVHPGQRATEINDAVDAASK